MRCGGESLLEIVSVDHDAPRNDNLKLNEEYFTFGTLVSGSLIGYAAEDQTGHRYEFPTESSRKVSCSDYASERYTIRL